MSRVFSAIITEEDGGFVSLNPETGIASQGDTVDDALANLREALELYFEEAEASGEKPTDSRPAFLTTITL